MKLVELLTPNNAPTLDSEVGPAATTVVELNYSDSIFCTYKVRSLDKPFDYQGLDSASIIGIDTFA